MPDSAPQGGEILVVEDAPASLALLSDLLGRAGHSVRQAPTGELALWTARHRPPELILLDIRLPDISGFEVCRQLKADPQTAHVPVIFLSAQHETDDKVRGFGLGAVDFVGKPFQPDEVLARVQTHITMGRLRNALAAERTLLDERVRQRTEELQAANRDLAQRNAELEVFAYVSSHDLREPLRTVSTYVTLLERRYADKLDQDGRTFIAFARDAAQRLDRLVLDLLEYARAGRSDEEPHPTDPRAVVDAVVASLGQLVAESGARVSVADGLPTLLVCEKDLFRLFQNLIDNAIKYRQPERPPAITVAAAREGGEWVFAVADNGLGIAPQYHDKVFGLFQRLDPRGTPAGTGIGLSVCRKVAEKYGGRIWVESSTEGSRFLFTLPEAAPAG